MAVDDNFRRVEPCKNPEDPNYNPIMDPEFSPEKLKKNWYASGEIVYVKIPESWNRIRREREEGKNAIRLVTRITTDPETKEKQEERITIGEDVSHYFPGMMRINDNYYDYFDLDGKPINQEYLRRIREEEEKAKQEREQAKQKKKEQAKQQKQQPERPTKPKAPEGDARTVDEIKKSLLEKEKLLREELQAAEESRQELERAWEEVEAIREAKIQALEEKDKDHFDLLDTILGYHEGAIAEQAKRRPEKYMKQTQICIINEILQEVKEILAGTDAAKYLHLAGEPREDDLEHYPGTTYGEMNILLNAYSGAMSAYRYNRLYKDDEEEEYYDEDDEE